MNDNDNDYIMLTGGCGYIGSHLTVELLKSHNVVIADSFVNSSVMIINSILRLTHSKYKLKFFKMDIRDPELETIFKMYNIKAVIHLAGLKSVSESIENPAEYYDVNVNGSNNVLELVTKYEVPKFLFSSSATVYSGNCPSTGFVETQEINPNELKHMYGRSKFIVELMTEVYADQNPNITFVSLRYFNPISNHRTTIIGEDLYGKSTNLFPFIGKAFMNTIPELTVYGNDYDTPDGTCLRDFIHICDLVKGHIAVLDNLDTLGYHTYNLGTGKPISVLDMIKTFEKVSGSKLNYSIGKRRDGDAPVAFANVDKVKADIGWSAELGIEEACHDFVRRLRLLV